MTTRVLTGDRVTLHPLEKLGFARTGQRWDAEDGALITWSRPLPSERRPPR